VVLAALAAFFSPAVATAQRAETYENEQTLSAVTPFMNEWREPSAVALSPPPLTTFSTVPAAWRDARLPDSDLADEDDTLLQGKAPREFGVRVRLSETDTAFVKILSFRGSPKARSLRVLPYLPETMLDRSGGSAFAAGVKLRF
jgi:hypothetical protein